MHHIDFYYDPISPYAYLAFERLPEALMGLSFSVRYRPILFAALLKHHAQLGPAEIEPKRNWTYRQVLWLGHAHGVPLRFPAAHPFNPLPLLRLAVACADEEGCTNRHVTEALLRHVWRTEGADVADPDRLAALRTQLAPRLGPEDEAVKARLRANTDEAIALRLFGVPTFVLRAGPEPHAPAGRQFWGFDALPMLRACLDGEAWFAEGGAWDSVVALPKGVERPR